MASPATNVEPIAPTTDRSQDQNPDRCWKSGTAVERNSSGAVRVVARVQIKIEVQYGRFDTCRLGGLMGVTDSPIDVLHARILIEITRQRQVSFNGEATQGDLRQRAAR